MFDLPAHLSNLNSIQSPPSQAYNAENEDAFWDFMHTDQLFENFGGVSPAAHDAKEMSIAGPSKLMAPPPVPAPTPAPTLATFTPSLPAQSAQPAAQSGTGPTLESFLAAFANDHASSSTGYRLPISLPLPYSAANTPGSGGVDTAAVIPRNNVEEGYTENGERLSGAKKLKQIGAAPAEIEEDKRRRNTEASARFRAKKKEREQALEQRAKELEAQVARLIADKSSLENENKLLKAIVLGSGQEGAEQQLQGVLTAMGGNANVKRKRED